MKMKNKDKLATTHFDDDEPPTCIYRGSNQPVSSRLLDDNFWHPRQTLSKRIGYFFDRLYNRMTR